MRRIYFNVYGNHSIAYKGKEIADKEDVIKRLDSLKFEESEFILEECKREHIIDDNREGKVIFNEKMLERDLKFRSWCMLQEFADKTMPLNEYRFKGPFGLIIDITNYSITIRQTMWFQRCEIKPFHTPLKIEEYNEWRNSWRSYFNQIIHVLGGDCAIYIPDESVHFTQYIIHESGASYDKVLNIAFNEFPHCLAASVETTKLNIKNMKDIQDFPIVVDKFEDVENIFVLNINS